MGGIKHTLGVAIDGLLDLLKSYIESLRADELELYFLGLMALGCVLSLYLLYSIYRRSVQFERQELEPADVPEVASTTGLAELLRDRGLAEEDRRKKKTQRIELLHSLESLVPAEGAPQETPPAPPPTPRRVRREIREEVLPGFPTAPQATSREGIVQKLRRGLARSREGFVARIEGLLASGTEIGEDTLAEMEEILITADLGLKTTNELLDGLRRQLRSSSRSNPDGVREYLRSEILRALSTLEAQPRPLGERPRVLMVVGVNGVGKTTTIAKLAHAFRTAGEKVIIAAADTFRAAAIEQLEIWAGRAGAEVVRQREGADPGAVAYDGLQAARTRDADVLIVDTAGRLHTKANLMEELKKVKRILSREMEGAPHEVLLVLDATTGQNALSQAKLFQEALGVTGIALAKLDGTAKGGIVVAIQRELGIPVRYIGIGEGMDDLKSFSAEEFVQALF